MMQILRLSILGPFEARRPDGEPVGLRNKKARALLAYLATEHGRSNPRERLAGMLWGNTRDERARHNLRQCLSAIRRSCGPVVVSDGDLLRLDPDRCHTDISEFERFAEAKKTDDLLRCLELYRGDLVEDLDPREQVFEEWLNLARGRLRKVACQVVDDLVRALEAEGRSEEAIQALERRLSMDPCCEAAHRRLMELLAGVGRRSEALRQYRFYEEFLERELGAEPDPETKELFERLQSSVPAAEPVAMDPGGATGTPARPRLAVLPFENLTGDGDGYFVDGIVEDITTALSCFHSLVVIARGASFAYRGRNVPERQVASELGAQFLVRGSVRREGQRIRVSIHLLDAFANLQLWAQRFDRDLEDVFAVQDEITSTVVSTLVGKVETARLNHARGAPTRSLHAYDLYLRGKDHHHRFTAQDCRACIDLFNRAIDRDPEFAVAHAWLACGLGQAIVFGLDDQAELVNRSQAAAERSLELDGNESECHRVLAQVFLIRRDLKKSIWHQTRGLFLNPNDDRSACSMGEILTAAGRHEEAEGWIRKSMQLNPYHSPRYWTHLGKSLFHLSRFDDALGALERVPRPRDDNIAYRVAAGVRIGDVPAVERHVAALREAIPEFDPCAFATSLPFDRKEDRETVRDALLGAGLGD